MPFHSLHIIMVNIVGLFPTKSFLPVRGLQNYCKKKLNNLVWLATLRLIRIGRRIYWHNA